MTLDILQATQSARDWRGKRCKRFIPIRQDGRRRRAPDLDQLPRHHVRFFSDRRSTTAIEGLSLMSRRASS